jgi:hypothetical protein
LSQPPQPLGDAPLGLVKAHEEDARPALDLIRHHRSVRELQLKRLVHDIGRDLQQLGRQRAQLVGASEGYMAELAREWADGGDDARG